MNHPPLTRHPHLDLVASNPNMETLTPLAPPNRDPQALLRHLQERLATMQAALDQLSTPDTLQPRLPPNIKPDRPAPFSGKKGESLETWIFQVEQYCSLLSIPIATQARFAATFLKDTAALWWRIVAPIIVAWSQFLAALRLQFTPVKAIMGAYDGLHRLTQR